MFLFVVLFGPATDRMTIEMPPNQEVANAFVFDPQ
jgi:hypothetical protein